MADFQVVGKSSNDNPVADLALGVMTGGISIVLDALIPSTPTYTYTVEDSGGCRHEVVASNSQELGEKISRGL